LGAEVLEFGSGTAALQALEGGRSADVLIVDWNLPGMDGLALVQELRRIPTHDRMRILMVTTEVEPPQVRAALDAGVQEYLMKPFTPEMLLGKLSLLGVEVSS